MRAMMGAGVPAMQLENVFIRIAPSCKPEDEQRESSGSKRAAICVK
jgi:hypothetical protein